MEPPGTMGGLVVWEKYRQPPHPPFCKIMVPWPFCKVLWEEILPSCVGVDVRCYSVAGGEEFMGDVQGSIADAQNLQADAMRLQTSMRGTLEAFFSSRQKYVSRDMEKSGVANSPSNSDKRRFIGFPF